MAVEFLKDYRTYPRMVRWFNPILLIRLLNNVINSSMFGQYADRRLMVAALDTVPSDVHLTRATALFKELQPAPDGSLWLDFVADLGDGFDSTYGMACVLARKEWTLDGATLPRGQLLVMGGDEVYPVANAQTYANQLRQPYSWAFPDHDRKDDNGVPLFAIPGNHDWYDGLVHFLAYFTRDTPTHFGNWRSRQMRSYFAIQLTKTWWLWAMDIQLADDMDQPQADYFKLIAKSDELQPGSRIILCTAEPGWLYTDTNAKSWEIVDYALSIASKADKGLTIPLLLSGDTHHYSRYEAPDQTQFVTSGGGGAFLHPTHQLASNLSLSWNSRRVPLTLGQKSGTSEQAVYPSMKQSRGLLWKNLLFAFTNWDFSIFMALVYLVVGILIGVRDHADVYILIALVMGAAIVGYTTTQENVSPVNLCRTWRKRLKYPAQFNAFANEKLLLKTRKAIVVVLTSLIHAAAHVLAAILTARYFAALNSANFNLVGEWYSVWKWLALLVPEMGAVGFLAGGTIFGLDMFVTCRWLRMNTNDAFSALRIDRLKNFLRLRITGDTVDVYAIGLEDVPRRQDWNDNPNYAAGNPDEPHWVPTNPLQPHLIETFTVPGGAGPA